MKRVKVVGLGGGIGASRLWRALLPALAEPADLTVVVNTADDMWMHGLRLCPDVDTTLYALAGVQDEHRGWGLTGESFRCMSALRERGGDVWMQLGDLDLATHLLRTGLLREGVGLTEIVRRLARSLDIESGVLPMTEQEVATEVTSAGRVRHYQEYLVRDGATGVVDRVEHVGTESAVPAPGVLDAIGAADVVALAPSSPIASMSPILGIEGIRAAVRDSAAAVVAVTPIVSRRPCTDPGERRRATARSALLAAAGIPPTAAGVARYYRDLEPLFILDSADAVERPTIESFGVEVRVRETLLHLGASPGPLVEDVLGACSSAARGDGRMSGPS